MQRNWNAAMRRLAIAAAVNAVLIAVFAGMAAVALELVFFFQHGRLYGHSTTVSAVPEKFSWAPAREWVSQVRGFSPTEIHGAAIVELTAHQLEESMLVIVLVAQARNAGSSFEVRVNDNVSIGPTLPKGQEVTVVLATGGWSVGENKVSFEPRDAGIDIIDARLVIMPEPPYADANGPSRLHRYEVFYRKSQRIRILAIGGSTTYGLAVGPDETWPAKLQIALEARYPGIFEVLNLGRLGGSLEEFIASFHRATTTYVPREKLVDAPRHEIAQWLTEGALGVGWKDLDADLVLVAPIVNDTAPDYIVFSAKRTGWLPDVLGVIEASLQAGVMRRSALVFYVHRAKLAVASRAEAPMSAGHEAEILAQIEKGLAERISRFHDQWDGAVGLMYLSLPLFFQSGDGASASSLASEIWNRDIAAMRREQHFMPRLTAIEREILSGEREAYCQPAQFLEELPVQTRLRHFLDAIHLNERGNALIAGSVLNCLNSTVGRLANAHTEKSTVRDRAP